MAVARALRPRVITCSWGWPESYVRDRFTFFPNNGATLYLRALEAEIRAAVADGITVLFASGNGPLPGSWPSSMPEVISVGGALVTRNLDLIASSYATSFASLVYQGRTCPDVCGLVGPAPNGLLFTLPTQPDNQFDAAFSAIDGTARGDGWMVASGTSSATPQVAGLVALLQQAEGPLPPAQVRARLSDLAIGVHQGTTGSGHVATAARPNLATGYGFAGLRRPHRAGGFSGLL
jgi:subtilisin family serine protease